MATYPSCITESQICSSCYNDQDNPGPNDCKQSGGQPCSAVCNSGCNTICDSSQAFCSIGVQTVTSHADVPGFPWGQVNKDDFIYKFWTADNWNKLIQQVKAAAELGQKQNNGINGSASTSIEVKQLITADVYNQVENLLESFDNASYATVNKNDLITAATSNNIKNSYETMKFKTSVCDICNVGNEHRTGDCNCNCNCSCNCSCSCTCPCSCSCNCSCPCGCSCPCSCSKPTG